MLQCSLPLLTATQCTCRQCCSIIHTCTYMYVLTMLALCIVVYQNNCVRCANIGCGVLCNCIRCIVASVQHLFTCAHKQHARNSQWFSTVVLSVCAVCTYSVWFCSSLSPSHTMLLTIHLHVYKCSFCCSSQRSFTLHYRGIVSMSS